MGLFSYYAQRVGTIAWPGPASLARDNGLDEWKEVCWSA